MTIKHKFLGGGALCTLVLLCLLFWSSLSSRTALASFCDPCAAARMRCDNAFQVAATGCDTSANNEQSRSYDMCIARRSGNGLTDEEAAECKTDSEVAGNKVRQRCMTTADTNHKLCSRIAGRICARGSGA